MHERTPQDEVRNLLAEDFTTDKFLAKAREQAIERNYDDFLIVDVDGHHYEHESNREVYEYISDPVIRHNALQSVKYNYARSTVTPGNLGGQDMAGRISRHELRQFEVATLRKEYPGSTGPHRDIEMTKRWMNAIGIDYVCLFPSPMLFLGLHPLPQYERALSQAYNRWLCERILAHEPRIVSMLYLPFNDPDAAYETVKEFGDKKGVVGFMVTSPRYKPVHDNAYMKTYALIEEMGKSISFHAAYNWNDQSLSLTNRFISVHALGFMWFNMVHLTNWVINGIPERFPKLRTMWIESGLTWAYALAQRLDHSYLMRTSDCPALKRLPSEYMQEMYYSTQPMEMPKDKSILENTFKVLKADTQLVYSSDYPHWDFDLPSTIYDLPFLGDAQKRNILGNNAARFFGLDLKPVKHLG